MTIGVTFLIFWLVLILGFLAGWIMRGWFLFPSDRD